MTLSGRALAMTSGLADRPSWGWARGNGPARGEPTCQEVAVSQVRVHNFSVSLDGFGTGEGQSLDAPFGHATGRLMEWLLATRTFHAMHDKAGGDTGVDEAFASHWRPGIGAEIMGRNKFGPQRGPWEDDEWK